MTVTAIMNKNHDPAQGVSKPAPENALHILNLSKAHNWTKTYLKVDLHSNFIVELYQVESETEVSVGSAYSAPQDSNPDTQFVRVWSTRTKMAHSL